MAAILEKEVGFHLTTYTDAVESDIATIFQGDEFYFYKNEILTASVQAWEVTEGEERLGTVLTQKQFGLGGRIDLVIIAFAGCVGMVKASAPFLEALAKLWGCTHMRVHTKRDGLERLIRPWGFINQEIILTREVPE